jgi:DNA polymerase gamma 1
MPNINYLSEQNHIELLGRKMQPISVSARRRADQEHTDAGLGHLVDKAEDYHIPLPDYGTCHQVVADAGKMALQYMSNLSTISTADIKLPELSQMLESGWYCNLSGLFEPSNRPADGSTMVLDVETVNESNKWYLTCLVAVTTEGTWYIRMFNPLDRVSTVSIGQNQTIIGHNISYDRSYISESYLLEGDSNRYYCTMGAFMVVRGMSTAQLGLIDSELSWTKETAKKSLKEVYMHYVGLELSKSVRDNILLQTPETIGAIMPEVLAYCMSDVFATWQVFCHVYPEMVLSQPNKVSWAGQMLLGNMWLPLSSDRFPTYYDRAETLFNQNLEEATAEVKKQALAFSERYKDIPEVIPQHLEWLDWTPGKSGKTKGQPKWYRVFNVEDITLKSRIVPTIMGLKYRGERIFWGTHPTNLTETGKPAQGYCTVNEFIPNPEDPTKCCSYLFSDKLSKILTDDVLTSDIPGLSETVQKAISCVNWSAMRKRVAAIKTESPEGFPVCVPTVVVTGTVTRRCADALWQCSPNAKKNRIGTEVRTMIEAPPGYRIVGADVDGQEAWIATMFADSKLGFTGSTAFSLMLYCGNKATKSDLMTVISQSCGVSRQVCKNIFYGMLYGLGLFGVKDYIRKSTPGIAEAEVSRLAEAIVRKVKGRKVDNRWVGGLASETFNYMEHLVKSATIRSPILNVSISKSLQAAHDQFQTTKINWTIQTSGVDMRDIVVANVALITGRQNVWNKLIMTIHDEYRYLVREEDVKDFNYCLQLAHIYARAYMIDSMGLEGLPAQAMYFSSVDVDHIWRKLPCPESAADYDKDPDNAGAMTPSQPPILPYGYTITPTDIMAE